MVPEGEFDPVGYESPSGPFVPAEVADLKATVDAGLRRMSGLVSLVI
jgi:hypothetical protein